MSASGYSNVVSRLDHLDSIMKTVDPDWTRPSMWVTTTAQSPFASILSDVASAATDSAEPADYTSIGATASAAAAAAAIDSTYNTSSNAIDGSDPIRPKYYNTIYSSLHVVGQVQSIDFSNPMPGARKTQVFGPSNLGMEPSAKVNGHWYAHYHDGIDLATTLGTPVLAAAAGTVIYSRRMSDGAVVVKIRHDDGYVSEYGHLQKNLNVKDGQRVERGQQIGLEGNTGQSTGPHLHFALFNPSGQAVDPSPFLETGHLPQAGNLASPLSTTNAGSTAWLPSSTALARFDAVSSRIPYASQIRSAAIANGIDPLLLAALVSNESSFHADSVSSAGAVGLTQLMPKVASGMGVTDAHDPQQNLDGGAKYLALQIKRFGRIDMALAAYSKGPGTVWKANGVPSSAKGYVRKVLEKWTRYEGMAS